MMSLLDKQDKTFDTVLIGLGRIASQYNKDPVMLKNMKYVTHAQVLADHKNYNWVSAIDLSSEACAYAKDTWNIDETSDSIAKLKNKDRYEIAVLATPPDFRLEAIQYFPSLKGIIVEKPLGSSYKSSQQFIDECKKRDIAVQVNLTRRSDIVMKELAGGELQMKIGNIQCVFGTYGRGLRNYGVHLIDLIRMLIGEIEVVQSLSKNYPTDKGPLSTDGNLSFVLQTLNGVEVIMQSLDFSNFREGSLDIWGEKGRIEIVNEGLDLVETNTGKCKSLSDALGLAFDKRTISNTGYGEALFDLYDNLVHSLLNNSQLDSPGDSALKTEEIVENIFNSFEKDGVAINCS